MLQTTFLTLESDGPIKPGTLITTLTARPQLRLRPRRLRIEPIVAPFFQIHEVRTGMRSHMPRGGQVLPASQFMHGEGAEYDLGEVNAGEDVIMFVENISDRIPGGRGGVPLAFKATWSCLVLPAFARHSDFGATDPVREDGRGIANTPELGKPPIGLTPIPRRREHPGFGWDPGYGDD